MGIIVLVLLLIVAIAIASAFYIAKAAAKKLKQENNQYVEGWTALIFLVSLIVIGGGIFLLIAMNVRLGR